MTGELALMYRADGGEHHQADGSGIFGYLVVRRPYRLFRARHRSGPDAERAKPATLDHPPRPVVRP